MSIAALDSLNLGKFMQIAFTDGIRNQISRDFRDFELIKRERVADPMGREIRFFFQKSLGPSAVQYRGVNSVNFPRGQQNTNAEHVAHFKEITATIELEQNVWKRAQMSKNLRYADPLINEVESKLLSMKKQYAKDLYGDGTGVLGTVASVAVEGGNLRFTLSSADTARGFVGWFELDEIMLLKAVDGTASALDTNLATEAVYYKVLDRGRTANTILVQGLDVNYAALTYASISVQPTAGDVFYKYEQPTIPDLGSPGDYGIVTEVMPGLESLTANDGRVIHGITMSGATKGSRYDVGNVAIDVSHIEAAMNDAKLNVGEGAYAWKQAIMAPETRSAFILSREGDRRFNSMDDNIKGVKKFFYQHGDDAIELISSSYCPKKRMYLIPEAKNGQGKVLEYHGTDFEPVKPMGGQEFMMKPGANGGHERKLISYVEGYGTLICKHPAAIAVLHNFTI